VKFRATVVIGNSDGYVGIASEKDVQVGSAIRKSIDIAKLNLIKVPRGCGSWECGCGEEHTVPFRVLGQSGSVVIELMPAPRGLGITAGTTATQVLEKAGIRDVWTRTSGQTRTTINFAKATFNALKQVNLTKVKSPKKIAGVAD
jgi:small subunit ribosomal protein S5